MAADRIYVDKASLVGSIGVIMSGFGFTGTMEKLGVERRAYTAGENKDFLDPFAPENPAHREHAKQMLGEIHQQFIKMVRDGRGKRLKESPEIFSGLVWTGERAVQLGLADGLGSLDSVARDVIKAETVVDFTPEENYFEQLSKRLGTGAAQSLAEGPVGAPGGRRGLPSLGPWTGYGARSTTSWDAPGSAAGSATDELGLIREAFDQTAVGLTLVSLEGEFFLVNRAFCELSGYLAGRARREQLLPGLAPRGRRARQGARSAGRARAMRRRSVEKMLRRRDGTTVWVRRTPGLMRDARGQPEVHHLRLRGPHRAARARPGAARHEPRSSPRSSRPRRSRSTPPTSRA